MTAAVTPHVPSRQIRLARGRRVLRDRLTRFGFDVIFTPLRARLEQRAQDILGEVQRLENDIRSAGMVLDRADWGESRPLTPEERRTIEERLYQSLPAQLKAKQEQHWKARMAVANVRSLELKFNCRIGDVLEERRKRIRQGGEVRMAFAKTPRGEQLNAQFRAAGNMQAFKAMLREARRA